MALEPGKLAELLYSIYKAVKAEHFLQRTQGAVSKWCGSTEGYWEFNGFKIWSTKII